MSRSLFRKLVVVHKKLTEVFNLQLVRPLVVAGLLLQGETPPLPEGPISGADILGAWLVRFLFAILGILVGWYAFKAALKHLPQILRDFIEGKNIVEALKLFGRFALSILLMVAAVRLPPVFFGEAASVDTVIKGGITFVRGFFSGFGN
jgi:hypothetical protein